MSYSINYYGADGTVIKSDTMNRDEISFIIEPEELLRLIENSYIRVSTDFKTAIEFGIKSMLIRTIV